MHPHISPAPRASARRPKGAPRLAYPPGTAPEDVPAVCVEHGDGTASVWHPGGPNHENARATIARHHYRGIRAVFRNAAPILTTNHTP